MSAQTGINPRPLDGKLAIVTGASRGIGAATCENFARKGCNLILGYASKSSTKLAEELAEKFKSEHSVVAIPAQIELGEEDCGERFVQVAKKHFGEAVKIDIIINNAGVSENQYLPDVTSTSFRWQYAVNVLAPLLIVQAAFQHLPKDRSGRIVNVSSVSTSLGTKKQSIYAGTKGALEAMTRVWARELAERATVNSINPGPVTTDMWGGVTPDFEEQMHPILRSTPLSQVSKEQDGEEQFSKFDPKGGRPATAEEIAGVIAMLVSQESSWCTGSVICANGGMRMSP